MNKMKKVLMAVVLLASCAVSAKADTGVYDVINDSITICDVSIASYTTAGTRQLFTASLVGSATTFLTVMENRKILEIQNINSTSSAFCRIDLSSTSASGDLSLAAPATLSATAGRMISPGGSWVLGLPARNASGRLYIPWCANNSGTGTINLTVTQAGKR